MNGMILAAGFGTRLAPLTDTLPKALIPVAGRRMIDWPIEALIRAGCTRIVINAHHHADALDAYLRDAAHAAEIVVLREAEILGTGGGILNAAGLLGDGGPFLVQNADIVADFDLSRLVEEQARSGALAVLAVNQRATARALCFAPDMTFLGKEVWSGDGLDVPGNALRFGFCGIHLVSPALFRCGHGPGYSDIFDVYRHAMRSAASLRGVCFQGHWHDLGSVERIRAFEDAGWRKDPCVS